MTDFEDKDFTFPFGKYKGKKLTEVKYTDGKYLIWLYKQDWVNEKTKNEIAKVLNDIILTFGRYDGKTLSEVRDCDLKYYDWLLSRDEH